MKKKDLISVIIPVYNVEKYIKKCVLSLVSQTYENCEFIFVNDGTKDNSMNILNEIKDKRIKIINQKNQGVSVARNNGLDSAKGEYIVFLDADDYVSNDYIEYLYKLVKKDDSDFAYSTNTFKSKNDKQIEQDIIKDVTSDESTAILLSPDVIVGCCNKIYKKSMIDDNNLRFRTDLFYGEGLNFIIRASLCSKKIVVGSRKLFFYRKNNMSSATTKYNNEKYHNGLKSLEIIANLVNLKNDYVNSMYKLHLSTFYLGAITQMISNHKTKQYKNDYKLWRKELKSNLDFIIKSKYITKYRKCMILVGCYFPSLIAMLDKKRRKEIIKNSVD